ncbi:MAG: DUF938 domain-containing protein [Cellvibrionales bacterium]|nr:DUF938 domain-containing protein [Cellvibrionales bacterium]
MPLFSASAERNKAPIFAVAEPYFRAATKVLEIGAGSGQHGRFFADQLPHLQWLLSDIPSQVPPLQAEIAHSAPPNLRGPLALDAAELPWPLNPADGIDLIYSANSLHIMGWPAVQGFFAGAGRLLGAGDHLLVYGPFKYADAFTAPSNAEFDRWLRQRDPASGVRDFEAVDGLAQQAGFHLREDRAMPANNQCLIWQRSD